MYSQARQNQYLPPKVEVVNHPHKNGTRFRYEYEERRCRILPDKKSGTIDKNATTILRVTNYTGPLSITVSCVEKDPPYHPHPHKIAWGDTVYKHGTYSYMFSDNPGILSLKNLNVRCIARRDMEGSLNDRESHGIDPFQTGFDHKYKLKDIDLNCVRFCFQVFLNTPFGIVPLKPVVSDEIHNRKSDPTLEIRYLSHNKAPANGGMQMCILCETIPPKTEVQVRFYDRNEEWEGLGKIEKSGIFRQAAIILRTPAYMNKNLSTKEGVVDVFVQMRRVSDGSVSDPFPFQFLISPPDDSTAQSEYDDIMNLKKRKRNDATLISHTKSGFYVDPRIFAQNGGSSKNNINKIMDELCPAPRQKPPSVALRKVPQFSSEESQKQIPSAQLNHVPQYIGASVARNLANEHDQPGRWINNRLPDHLAGMNSVMNPTHSINNGWQEPRHPLPRPTSHDQQSDAIAAPINGSILDPLNQNLSSEINTSDLISFQNFPIDPDFLNCNVFGLQANGNYEGTTPGTFAASDMVNISSNPVMRGSYRSSSEESEAKLIDI
ncbi:hypothetical protein QAD02_004464 [Eretmocerus hayati]|uniref:Uncharacterized protein n=1 Tax=Eretmocerus hayati TaxID=131215 RepID=A0ACC2NQ16_9HYME|nr:hypothetical protein QAD02_004464 [Eretmocerus hayati]